MRHGDAILPDDPKPSLTVPTASIVLALVKSHTIPVADLPALFSQVRSALAASEGPAPVPPQEPAANLRRLVTGGSIICAECGERFKSMKRHLASAHNLTASAYRAKWSLRRDHPMVAPDYSAARSKLATSMGLGRKPTQ